MPTSALNAFYKYLNIYIYILHTYIFICTHYFSQVLDALLIGHKTVDRNTKSCSKSSHTTIGQQVVASNSPSVPRENFCVAAAFNLNTAHSRPIRHSRAGRNAWQWAGHLSAFCEWAWALKRWQSEENTQQQRALPTGDNYRSRSLHSGPLLYRSGIGIGKTKNETEVTEVRWVDDW